MTMWFINRLKPGLKPVVVGGTLGAIVASITTTHPAWLLILRFNQQKILLYEVREARCHVFCIKRGLNMSDHVLFYLLNSFGKKGLNVKCEACRAFYRFLRRV